MSGVWGIGFVFLCEGYLREWRGGSKGVFRTLWRYRLIPGRAIAMSRRCRAEACRWCGDPQGDITNGCGFRQCKTGKNRLVFSEDMEQVACVSVHCKLVTRATHLDAYSDGGQGGVKSKLFSGCSEQWLIGAVVDRAAQSKRKLPMIIKIIGSLPGAAGTKLTFYSTPT